MRRNLFIPTIVVSSIFFFTSVNVSVAAEGNPMVKVPGGKFKSGTDGKAVDVKGFEIDKYEVTFAQYSSFDSTMEVPEGKENHPVNEVSFEDAEKYCKSLGKRLPTAIEWEKAARGEDGRKFPWGDTFDSNKANTSESGINGTSEITGYKEGASPYGALNMVGNVTEWINDWADAEKKYRVLMGCSYFDSANACEVSSKTRSIPDDIHPYNGFRCAK